MADIGDIKNAVPALGGATGETAIALPSGHHTVQAGAPEIRKTTKGAELIGKLNLALNEKVLKERGGRGEQFSGYAESR